MTDKELLQLAAEAAGYKWHKGIAEEREAIGKYSLWLLPEDGSLGSTAWNPLENDGHALRLAVRLGILLRTDFIKQLAELMRQGMDHCTATRRAIVRTAADIGRTKSTPTTPTGDER